MEIEEVNGLPYRKCVYVRRKPLLLEQNNNAWCMFKLASGFKLFRDYPFLLRDYIEANRMRISEFDLLQVAKLYNKYFVEKIGKSNNILKILANI